MLTALSTPAGPALNFGLQTWPLVHCALVQQSLSPTVPSG